MTDSQTSRLDVAVTKKLSNISRAQAAKLIEQGFVQVNAKVITKSSLKVSSEDKLNISYDFQAIKIPKIKLPIIYEDNDVLVINKPIGLLSHSKGSFNVEPTVATWLEDHFEGAKSERAGIVHRLDRATSGVMIVAKNEQSYKWLQKQFSTRKVRKVYVAIVSGHLNHVEALIDLPIERNPKTPQSFRVGPSGKSASTEYTVLDSNDSLSLVELRPTTGRTHQLRVHLAHLGHPIIGDTIYHGKVADRLYLHAKSLEITLPSKVRSVFEVPLPREFKIYMSNERPTP